LEKADVERLELEEKRDALQHEIDSLNEQTQHYVVEDIMRDVNSWMNDC